MRILVFNWQDRLHPQSGGAETHLHEIFSRLVVKGDHVTLVSCGFEGAPSRETVDGIDVHRIGSRSTFNYVLPVWWWRHGRHMDVDVVVDDINKLPLMTPLFVKRPIVGIVHHLFGDSIYLEAGRLVGSYVQLFERRIPQVYRNTPIAVVSESTRTECRERGLPDTNLHVIHNGMDAASFPMAVGEKAPVPTITSFGRLKRYKSVDHIINAMPTILEALPDARLEIIGKGDDRPFLESRVAALGIQASVEFVGFVTNDEKIRRLQRSHVMVNTSMKEGWGITNLEANACGVPVVSADSPGLRDSVKPGQSGLLYPFGSTQDLASTVLRVLRDEDLRQQLSNGAVAWAQQFTWDRSAEQMRALCDSAVASWHAS